MQHQISLRINALGDRQIWLSSDMFYTLMSLCNEQYIIHMYEVTLLLLHVTINRHAVVASCIDKHSNFENYKFFSFSL